MRWVSDNRHGHHSHGDDGEHSNAAQSKAPGCLLRNLLHSGRHSRMPIDLADEAVSALGKGFNVARRLCIVAQCGANLPYGGVKPLIEIYEGFTAPDLLLDLLASKIPIQAATPTGGLLFRRENKATDARGQPHFPAFISYRCPRVPGRVP